MPRHSLFALLCRLFLVLGLVFPPLVVPSPVGAATVRGCCANVEDPSPHSCCCDVAEVGFGGPSMRALCCAAGEVPPFVPASTGIAKASFQRIDIDVAVTSPAAAALLLAPMGAQRLNALASSPPGAGRRLHLRVHVLRI